MLASVVDVNFSIFSLKVLVISSVMARVDFSCHLIYLLIERISSMIVKILSTFVSATL